MSKNNLENLFKNLENTFDVEMPETGHETRFLDKLNTKKEAIKIIASKRTIWKPLLGIAASIVIIITIFISTPKQKTSSDLASVSPKMAEAQDFFTLTINDELNKLNSEASPEVQGLINDALLQIKKLEENYNSLKTDLQESGDDNRVIYAMISNFQNRIDILQNTLNQIKNVKQLKNSSNETSITI
ncbi:hypothetical protein SAMN05428642_104105 [Flaviramulus basaltis]|uniref:DUF4179 domain-containing protein n=1 Tax=Flaviramulus basaltis TaxID=369401 RepID=A0A1K2IRK2_9FLAO|nr:hypothetical protein [Flaviramulus basaltis]SFZ94347.1 hypothetical protein SAMN05428642_104105 [Flaviramulus basaltis]